MRAGGGRGPRRALSLGSTPRVFCVVSPPGHTAAPIPADRGTPVLFCPWAASGARFAAAQISISPESASGSLFCLVFFHFTAPLRENGRPPRSNGPPGRVCPRPEPERVVRSGLSRALRAVTAATLRAQSAGSPGWRSGGEGQPTAVLSRAGKP